MPPAPLSTLSTCPAIGAGNFSFKNPDTVFTAERAWWWQSSSIPKPISPSPLSSGPRAARFISSTHRHFFMFSNLRKEFSENGGSESAESDTSFHQTAYDRPTALALSRLLCDNVNHSNAVRE